MLPMMISVPAGMGSPPGSPWMGSPDARACPASGAGWPTARPPMPAPPGPHPALSCAGGPGECLQHVGGPRPAVQRGKLVIPLDDAAARGVQPVNGRPALGLRLIQRGVTPGPGGPRLRPAPGSVSLRYAGHASRPPARWRGGQRVAVCRPREYAARSQGIGWRRPALRKPGIPARKGRGGEFLAHSAQARVGAYAQGQQDRGPAARHAVRRRPNTARMLAAVVPVRQRDQVDVEDHGVNARVLAEHPDHGGQQPAVAAEQPVDRQLNRGSTPGKTAFDGIEQGGEPGPGGVPAVAISRPCWRSCRPRGRGPPPLPTSATRRRGCDGSISKPARPLTIRRRPDLNSAGLPDGRLPHPVAARDPARMRRHRGGCAPDRPPLSTSTGLTAASAASSSNMRRPSRGPST